MASDLPKISKSLPVEYLQGLVADKTMPAQIRADAAKALLPYTAKKTAETLETFNTSYVVKNDRLKNLDDKQLAQLYELLKLLSIPGESGDGDSETEVQHD